MGSGYLDEASKIILHVSSGPLLLAGRRQRLNEKRMSRTPEEFLKLFREHQGVMFRIARNILRDDQAAEDAVQDAAIKAFERWPKLKHEGNLKSWLLRIVKNCAIDISRKRRPIDELDEAAASDNHGVLAIENTVLLSKAIAALPRKQQSIIVLTAEGYSIAEIADALGMQEEAVKQALYRARQALRTTLNEEDFK